MTDPRKPGHKDEGKGGKGRNEGSSEGKKEDRRKGGRGGEIERKDGSKEGRDR